MMAAASLVAALAVFGTSRHTNSSTKSQFRIVFAIVGTLSYKSEIHLAVLHLTVEIADRFGFAIVELTVELLNNDIDRAEMAIKAPAPTCSL